MRASIWIGLLGAAACGGSGTPLEPSGRNDPDEQVTELPPEEPPDPGPTDPSTTPPEPEPEGCDAGGSPEALDVCGPGAVAVVDDRPFASLQEAIDAASDGTTVWLCPGESNEGVVVQDRILRIEVALPNFGRLDGDDQRRLFDIVGSDVTLRGLDIRNGRESADGGAIRSRMGSRLALECVSIASSGTALAGGALSSRDSELIVEDSTFRQNDAQLGGAVRITGSTLSRPARFLRTTFDDNRSSGSGGAIHIGGNSNDAVLIEDCIFDANEAGNRGGAIALVGDSSPSITVVGTEFDNNEATQSGGAIYVDHEGPADITFQRCDLEDQEAPIGAAVAVTNQVPGGTVTFVDSRIEDNTAGTGNGAIQSDGDVTVVCTNCDLGAGIFDNQPHDVVVQGVPFDGNEEVDFQLPGESPAP